MRYPDESALGDAIREVRKRRDLSQEALADAASMHRTYLGGIERGERNVSFKNLTRIAMTLEVPISELILLAERNAK